MKKFITNTGILVFLFFPLRKIYRKYKSIQFSNAHARLRKLYKNVEGGILTFKVPEFKGYFDINVNSDLSSRLLLFKSYEPDIVQVLQNHLNVKKDVIDVGANVGFYSVFFAKSIGDNQRVLSIEPTPGALKLLKKNIQQNDCAEKVTIFNGVLSDTKGELSINMIPGMEEYSSLGKLAHSAVDEKKKTSIQVSSETLDNLVAEYKLEPGIIKIDVEGAEFLVLNGAEETIKKYHPTFVIEVSDHLSKSLQTTSSMLFQFLENFNYKITDMHGSLINAVQRNQFNGDILAVSNFNNDTYKLSGLNVHANAITSEEYTA